MTDDIERLKQQKPIWRTFRGNRLYCIKDKILRGYTLMHERPYYGHFTYENGSNIPKKGWK